MRDITCLFASLIVIRSHVTLVNSHLHIFISVRDGVNPSFASATNGFDITFRFITYIHSKKCPGDGLEEKCDYWKFIVCLCWPMYMA